MPFSHLFFVNRLKNGLKATGHQASDISCHSFRRGGVTLAFALGLFAIDIKLRGDWRSNAFQKYLFVTPEANLSAVRTLVYGAASMERM
jgi:hypothetical protein